MARSVLVPHTNPKNPNLTPTPTQAYIAVDNILGHLASNGLAPYPKAKTDKLIAALADVCALLDKGQ